MKQITIVITLVFVFHLSNSFGQGGGKLLVFDGTNNNVELKSTFQNQDGTKSFSFCAWIKSTNVGKAGQRVLCDDENNTKGYALSLGDPGSGLLRFYVRGLSTVSLDVPSGANQLSNNIWYHVAAVYDQSSRTRYIYVNGVVAASHTHGAGEWTSSEVDAGPVTIGGESDGSAESTNRFQGQIDEVSYWNKALSQTEIRDLMCKSLIGSEPNLYGYWNFDGAGMGVNNVPDLSSNGLTGTMKNMNATEIVVSSIPLGTASAYSYPVSWTGFSLTLGSTSKGNMEVKTVTGTPVSVHIYRVDNVPNYTTGLSGLGNNNTYFGVFIVGGTSPTYTSVFDYSNYPDANTNEATLMLNSRIDNSITTWVDASATLNTGLNTLTKTGNNNRAEFILSNPSSPLPIKLLSFEANFNVDKVDLKWITASEINNDYFTIEKSKDLKNWEIVSNINGAGNSNTTIEYLDVDYSPKQGISYYRLKQTDFDGAFTYSNIVPVRVERKQIGEFSLFPNPIQPGEHLKIQFSEIIESEVLIVLRDTKGEEFFSKVVLNYEDKSLIAIPIDKTIPSGIYLVTASSENQIYNQKLIIKGSSNN